MSVTVNQAAIQNPGTYVCNIKVSSVTAAMTAGPATLTITINTVPPTLTSATPNPIVVDAPQGATAAITVPVTLTGTGTFTFLANAVALTPQPNPTWLAATGGTLTNGTGTSTVTITVGNLAPGQYVGSVAYSGPGTSTLALLNVPVILNVGAITANPTSIGFNHTLGFTPASQQATLVHLTTTVPAGADSLGHNGLQFTAAATTTNGGNWLTVAPASGSVNSSASTDLTVSYTVPTTCTPTAATPCVYNGNVAVATTGTNTVINIPVTLTVFTSPP